MGCYYQKDNQLFVTDPESIFHHILSIENAIIEKYEYYWKITEIKTGTPLLPERHVVIREQAIVDPYCNICRDRLISISGGCNTCSFAPICSVGPTRITSLIEQLKSILYYEVDLHIFKIEVQREANRKK